MKPNVKVGKEVRTLFLEVEQSLNENMQEIIFFAASSNFDYRMIYYFKRTPTDYEFRFDVPLPSSGVSKSKLAKWKSKVQKHIANINPEWMLLLEMNRDSENRAIVHCELESPLGHWSADWKNQTGYYSNLQLGLEFKETAADDSRCGGFLYKKQNTDSE